MAEVVYNNFACNSIGQLQDYIKHPNPEGEGYIDSSLPGPTLEIQFRMLPKFLHRKKIYNGTVGFKLEKIEIKFKFRCIHFVHM
jgi:hypothetical protein